MISKKWLLLLILISLVTSAANAQHISALEGIEKVGVVVEKPNLTTYNTGIGYEELEEYTLEQLKERGITVQQGGATESPVLYIRYTTMPIGNTSYYSFALVMDLNYKRYIEDMEQVVNLNLWNRRKIGVKGSLDLKLTKESELEDSIKRAIRYYVDEFADDYFEQNPEAITNDTLSDADQRNQK